MFVEAVVPCRFGGASALEEDRAARKLEVDEHGIARRVSNDIWSDATSRQRSLLLCVNTTNVKNMVQCNLQATFPPAVC